MQWVWQCGGCGGNTMRLTPLRLHFVEIAARGLLPEVSALYGSIVVQVLCCSACPWPVVSDSARLGARPNRGWLLLPRFSAGPRIAQDRRFKRGVSTPDSLHRSREPASSPGQASKPSLDELLKHRFVEQQVRNGLLKLRVFLLAFSQSLHLRKHEPGGILLPVEAYGAQVNAPVSHGNVAQNIADWAAARGAAGRWQ